MPEGLTTRRKLHCRCRVALRTRWGIEATEAGPYVPSYWRLGRTRHKLHNQRGGRVRQFDSFVLQASVAARRDEMVADAIREAPDTRRDCDP